LIYALIEDIAALRVHGKQAGTRHAGSKELEQVVSIHNTQLVLRTASHFQRPNQKLSHSGFRVFACKKEVIVSKTHLAHALEAAQWVHCHNSK